MAISSAFELQALHVGPHDLSADLRVFDACPRSRAFVTLDLRAGASVMKLYLPARAYNVARAIADLWPTIADVPTAPTLSLEAMKIMDGGAVS